MGRPGNFFTGNFLTGAFLAGAFLAGAFFAATFLAGAFFAGAFFAFLAIAFLAFLSDSFLGRGFFSRLLYNFFTWHAAHLMRFSLVTNSATHGLDSEPAIPCAKSALKRPSPREHAGRSASHETG